MKTTKATVKSFIKKNFDNLYIKNKSSFDGMVDCVMPINGNFRKAERSENHETNTLGISGAWFVGSSRDYFSPYKEEGFEGIKVYNSCGSFVLAIKQ